MMDGTQTTILVLAANGKTGRRVADRLEARDIEVRRASRSGNVRFDWDDLTTWRPALQGVDAAYVVYTPDLAVPAAPTALERFVDLAVESGLGRLVLLSGRGEPEAQRCEQIVLNSGIPATIVRASWFAQNFTEGAFLDQVLDGVVALPADAVREPFIDVDDIADVAVAALTESGHAGEVYEVTGPRLLTFADAVGEIAAGSGHAVRYQSISSGEFTSGLAHHGLPEETVSLLSYLFDEVLDGRNAYVTDDVARAIGREARDFSMFVRDATAVGAWDSKAAA